MQADIKVYAQAVLHFEALDLSTGDDSAFQKAIRDLGIARDSFMAARERLHRHISNHGCAEPKD